MSFQKYLDVNRKAIFDKLDRVTIIESDGKKLYIANDIIDAISELKIRDKRLINDWTEEYIKIVKYAKPNDQIRTYRVFTKEGITKYLAEGKIYSYKNACEYFGISFTNKQYNTWENDLNKFQLTDGNHDLRKILRWIYEKKKSCERFPDEISWTDLIKKIENSNTDYNTEKLQWLKNNWSGRL